MDFHTGLVSRPWWVSSARPSDWPRCLCNGVTSVIPLSYEKDKLHICKNLLQAQLFCVFCLCLLFMTHRRGGVGSSEAEEGSAAPGPSGTLSSAPSSPRPARCGGCESSSTRCPTPTGKRFDTQQPPLGRTGHRAVLRDSRLRRAGGDNAVVRPGKRGGRPGRRVRAQRGWRGGRRG